jgi:hypothetical protein
MGALQPGGRIQASEIWGCGYVYVAFDSTSSLISNAKGSLMARFVEFGNQCVNPDHVVTLGVVKDASGETFTKITLINGESISVAVELRETMRMLDNRQDDAY